MSGSIQDLGRLQVWTVMRLTQPPSGLVPGLLLPVISATRPGTVFSTGPSRQTNITVADRKALPGACRTTQRSRRLAEGVDEGAAHPLRIAKAGGLHAHDPLPSLGKRSEFHDVDPALTTLIFGHKRLRLMKTINQLALSQTCGFAFTKRIRFTKDGPDDFKHRMCANIAAFIFLVALGRTGGYRCPRLLRVRGPARLLLCVNAMS
jgi:hypothetical protein